MAALGTSYFVELAELADISIGQIKEFIRWFNAYSSVSEFYGLFLKIIFEIDFRHGMTHMPIFHSFKFVRKIFS